MHGLFEIFGLMMKEQSIMDEITVHLENLSKFNHADKEIINDEMNRDDDKSAEFYEKIIDNCKKTAKEYFTIAQLYLQRANVNKQFKSVREQIENEMKDY